MTIFHRMRAWVGVLILLLLPTVGSGWVRDDAPLWPDGTIRLQFQLGQTPTYTDGTTPNLSGAEAVRDWNSSIKRVQLSAVPNSTAGLGAGNGANNVFFSPTVYGQAFGAETLAVTLIFVSGGVRSETDVVVNQRQIWDSYRGPANRSTSDIRRVLAHEFGHVLGLDHPDEKGELVSALMNSRIGDYEAPTDNDLYGAAALYGLGPGVPGSALPSVILMETGSLSVQEGSPVAFSVSIPTSGPVVFEWFRDGVLIAGENRSRLRIDAARPSDAGKYVVKVTGFAGSVTRDIGTLTVNPSTAPVILSQRIFLNIVAEGDSVSFSFNVRGAGPLTQTWRRDGVIVAERTAGTDESGSFSLNKVTMVDAGNYTLTVSNRLGSATSEPSPLAVQPPEAPVILNSLSSVLVELGERVIFSPSVSGNQPLRFEWRKDGMVLPGETSSVFSIPKTAAKDAGAYSFKVSNWLGYVDSPPVQVRLANAPSKVLSISDQPTGGSLLFPGTVYLAVGAVGTPPLSYQWFKDGVAVPGKTEVAYSLFAARPSDLGAFSVRVSDSTGSVTSDPANWDFGPSARLLPWIVASPSSIAVRAGQAVDWAAYCFFVPPISYQWLRDGVAVPGQTTQNFILKEAQISDAGEYTFWATNANGTSVGATARLTVFTSDPPVILRHPVAMEINEMESVILRVELVDGAWQSVTWQRDGAFVAGALGKELYIASASKAQAGAYRAVVSTPNGGIVYSEPALLKVTPAGLPFMSRRLVNRSVVAGERADLNAFPADSPLPITFQWKRNGTIIPGQTRSVFSIPSMSASDVGTYSVTLTNLYGTTSSNECTLSLVAASTSLPSIRSHPVSRVVALGAFSGVGVEVGPSEGILRYQWRKDGISIPGANDRGYSFVASPAVLGRYSVVVSNTAGSVVSEEAVVTILPGTSTPLFKLQPKSQQVVVGSSVAFSAYVSGAPLPTYAPPTYQWRKNGLPISGATLPTLGFPKVDLGDAGTYSVVATNTLGVAVSEAASLSVLPSGRLLNLSARALTRGGDDVLITGFVVQGSGVKRLLVRAIGPALGLLGVSNALPDPQLKLFDAGGVERYSLDDWGRYPNGNALTATSVRIGAFALPNDSKDASFLISLEPGAYTAHITSVEQPSPRVALVEVYDAENGAPRLINLSTRARVETGEGALIAGFVVDAGAPKRILVRAIGPGLAAFGVPGALDDPVLTVKGTTSSGIAATSTNDDWSTPDTNGLIAAEIAAAAVTVGAFPLSPSSRDACLLLTLAPGNYTAQVTGKNSATGIALVEVYEVNN